MEVWKRRDESFSQMAGYGNLNPITVIRNVLSECPDEVPAPETSKLSFIEDEDFEKTLRLDISAANSSFANSEWKAATVLAGSVVETLLLWRLSDVSKDQLKEAAVAEKISEKKFNNPNEWKLESLIKVSKNLELVNEPTAIQADLARGFRNLIHPGREIRLNQKCSRGTAHSALAAVEHIVEDFSSRMSGD